MNVAHTRENSDARKLRVGVVGHVGLVDESAHGTRGGLKVDE